MTGPATRRTRWRCTRSSTRSGSPEHLRSR